MKLATIDIGTNTTLLLVVEVDGDAINVLDERAEITRLGRGIGAGGGLGDTGLNATLAALRGYAALVHQHGARLAVIGTEALRRAPNADAFLAPAAQLLGTPVQVIDGEREAALTYRATLESFRAEAAAGWLAVVDIGGGSTEIVLAQHGAMTFHTSLPLGSVRLTERFIHDDPPPPASCASIETEVAAALKAIPFPEAPLTLVGVAGTVTTLAAMALQMASYDPARVHGWSLHIEALDDQIARLATARQSQREAMIGLDPRRADVILAGALLLRGIARRAGVSQIRVSDRGIRWGLLYDLRDSLQPPKAP